MSHALTASGKLPVTLRVAGQAVAPASAKVALFIDPTDPVSEKTRQGVQDAAETGARTSRAERQ
jgi:hypothetical protein